MSTIKVYKQRNARTPNMTRSKAAKSAANKSAAQQKQPDPVQGERPNNIQEVEGEARKPINSARTVIDTGKWTPAQLQELFQQEWDGHTQNGLSPNLMVTYDHEGECLLLKKCQWCWEPYVFHSEVVPKEDLEC